MAKTRVGISIGDINGIGPEVILKTFTDNRVLQACIPVVYGSTKTLNYHAKVLNMDAPQVHEVDDSGKLDPKKINVVKSWEGDLRTEMGAMTEQGGQAAFQALEKAAQALASNQVDILLTAPINKKSIQGAGFQFPGHTEYLADMAGEEPLMIMAADGLRVGMVTGHMALKDVPGAISQELILKKMEILHKSLLQDFGIVKPKIAVLGLNPHAGEAGTMGTEEQEIIAPAIRKANDQGMLAMGPFPSDGFFGAGMYKQYDGILAMYHDQGLAPFKSIAFDLGVNYTAGLPIVRTSPDHGTGYAIAGKNEASEMSFRHALFLGLDVYKNRASYKEIHADPLPVSERKNRDRGK